VAIWDPRLADPMVLLLAGRRLLHRQAQPPRLSWQEVEGLASLLEYARHLPARDPQDLEAGNGPFAQLLREARQWQAEQEEA
jgi:hypothetical protein